jgi:amidase
MNTFATLIVMRDALREKRVSASELVEQHIARIERRDGPLNAVVVRDFERARVAAHDADVRIAVGTARALEGVPVTIKEALNVEGLVTSVGDAASRDYVSSFDAPTVARLKAAGAVVLGKTNLPVEMADWQCVNPVYGRTNNPWDLRRSPGGSSGGGAAVAAGFAPLDIGSDIGGSIRVPAAFCGVYGLRPSETLLPKSGHYPVKPLPNPAAVLGVQGPIARSAEDIEAAVRILAGPDVGEDVAWKVELPKPRHEDARGFRVAVLDGPEWAPVDAELIAARDRVADALAKAGARVGRAQPEEMGDWREHFLLYLRMLGYMMSLRWSDDERRRRSARMRRADDEFSHAQPEGVAASAAQLFMWHVGREKVRAAWRRFFGEWDALLAPAFHTPAFEHIDFAGAGPSASETRIAINGAEVPYLRGLFYPHIATLAGQPALACPAGLSRAGLPLGVQLVGPYLEDLTVTRLASVLAREIGGFVAPPAFKD